VNALSLTCKGEYKRKWKITLDGRSEVRTFINSKKMTLEKEGLWGKQEWVSSSSLSGTVLLA
jgi:hypothetical protein